MSRSEHEQNSLHHDISSYGDIQAVTPVHAIIAWKMSVQGTFKQVKILSTECDFVIAKGKDHCITSSSLGLLQEFRSLE
jgi:hypothetical protein